MKKYLNTLFVTTQGAYLAKDGECVLVKVDREDRLRLPIHTLDGIVCFGNVTCSPFLMGFCAERDVTVSFLTEHGRFLARVQGPVSGNVLLRRQQYRNADDSCFSTSMAKSFVAGKVHNCRTVILRALRDHTNKVDEVALRDAAERLSSILMHLQQDMSLDCARGFEGEAAKTYFGVFDQLITTRKVDFFFRERSRRPPLDRMNCLLSFLYTLILHDTRSALDMMEEFRPFLADRLVLSLVNLGQLKAKGFKMTETGAVLMDDVTRKTVLVAYQKRKQDEIMHPFLNEKMAVGLLFYAQALLLARFLRGDLDGYPPFLWK